MTEGTGSQLVGLWNMSAMDTGAIKDHLKNKHLKISVLSSAGEHPVIMRTESLNMFNDHLDPVGLQSVLIVINMEVEITNKSLCLDQLFTPCCCFALYYIQSYQASLLIS